MGIAFYHEGVSYPGHLSRNDFSRLRMFRHVESLRIATLIEFVKGLSRSVGFQTSLPLLPERVEI